MRACVRACLCVCGIQYYILLKKYNIIYYFRFVCVCVCAVDLVKRDLFTLVGEIRAVEMTVIIIVIIK